MKTDRELLEAAARAANIHIGLWHTSANAFYRRTGPSSFWNPLRDNDDALDLVVKLRLAIDHNHPADNDSWVMATASAAMVGPTEDIHDEIGRATATRRAIVRAAAAMAP